MFGSRSFYFFDNIIRIGIGSDVVGVIWFDNVWYVCWCFDYIIGLIWVWCYCIRVIVFCNCDCIIWIDFFDDIGWFLIGIDVVCVIRGVDICNFWRIYWIIGFDGFDDIVIFIVGLCYVVWIVVICYCGCIVFYLANNVVVVIGIWYRVWKGVVVKGGCIWVFIGNFV